MVVRILADHVRENGNHYEYDIGDDSYAIPKSVVDHIEAGGMPAPCRLGRRQSRRSPYLLSPRQPWQ